MAIREFFRLPGFRKQSVVVSDGASDSTGHESNSSSKSSRSTNPLKLVKSLSLMKSRTNSSINSNASDKSNVADGADNIKIIKGDNSANTIDPSVNILDDDGSNSNNNSGLTSTLDRPEKGVPSWLKKKNKKAKKDADKKPMHPSEKPLTLVNIQHQEMLNQFTWTFGNRRDSYDSRASITGVSPGNSRLPSFDHGSRPMPAGSPLAGCSGVDDDEQQGDYFMMSYGRRDAFQSSLLSPDSAALGRRPAMQMV